MRNIPEAIEKIDEIVRRLSMFIQVQTQEVIQDLNKIKEILQPTEEIAPIANEIEAVETKQETTEEQTETKAELVARYIEKFQKKPFA